MKTDGSDTKEGEADDNVIRLPRDWLGPTEKLVPMGSRARELEAQRTAASEDVETPSAAFWSEDAATVQHAVPVHSGRARRRPRFEWPRVPAGRLRSIIVAGCVLLLVILGVLGVAERPHHHRNVSSVAATSHAASPAGGAGVGSHPTAGAAGRSRVRPRRHPRVHHAAATRHAHQTVSRERRQRVHRAVRVVHHAVSPAITTDEGVTTMSVPAQTYTAPTTTEPAPVAAPVVRHRASGRSSHSAASGPVGTSDPGSAIGCNPQCS